MRLLKSLLAVTAITLLLAAPAAAVQINEIRIDQPGGDDNEYIELKGTPGESLDGISYVVIGDGSTGSGTIDSDGVIDLTGNVIPADGIFLIAESAWTAAVDLIASLGFENSDNVTHLLVRDNTGSPADDLDTDDDCVLDVTAWSAIVDGIALVEEANPPTATECHYGAEAGAEIGPDGTFVPGHVYRCGETWFIGGFVYPTDDTPGTANTNCPVSTFDRSWGRVKTQF